MLNQVQVGPIARQVAGQPPMYGGALGETMISHLAPDNYMLVKQGKMFVSSLLAANPAAFSGGAAGTPLIGLYNPFGSGVDLVLIEVLLGIRTTGTAAAAVAFAHWLVNQGPTGPTAATVAPRQLYSLSATGSAAAVFQNTVNTAAITSFLARPSISLGNVGITAGVNVGMFRDEVKGEIIVPPGGYYAFGSTTALTAASLDVSVMWAELPY